MQDTIEQKNAFMAAALKEAEIAFEKGEIPVGAVIVKDNKIIASAHNMNRELANPVKHAEIMCIEDAASGLNNERLLECDLYVTKEPCVMCAGAIVHARIRRVFIGAEDEKYGACGTVLSVCGNSRLNHVPEIEFGILREESANILKEFFQNLREKD